MKIAIVVKGFPPSTIAGTEVATEHIARHLASRGLEVHVITLRKEGEKREEERFGFAIHRITQKEGLPHGYSVYKDLKETLKEINPDIIHAQGLYSESFYCSLIAKKLGKKFAVFPRGSDLLECGFFTEIILKYVLKKADIVFSQTDYMKNRINETVNLKSQPRIIPNGIDIEKFSKINKRESRTRLKLPEKSFIFLFVGRFVEKKNPVDVIRAFKLGLETTEPSCEINPILVMVGAGPLKEKAEELIKTENLTQSVMLTGELDNKMVPRFMAAADTFVLPSYAEGFPMTFMEAMASGLPVLTSDDGANPEIIRDGLNGFISKTGDIESLARNMQKIMNNQQLRNKISEINRNFSEKYSWESVSSKLVEDYESLV